MKYYCTIVLSPGFAFPYFIIQSSALQNVRDHAEVISSFSLRDNNSFAPVVKNKQYNAPDDPPMFSSAISAICVNNKDG